MEERGGREGKGRVPSTLPPVWGRKNYSRKQENRTCERKHMVYTRLLTKTSFPQKECLRDSPMWDVSERRKFFFFFMEKIKHVTRAPRSEKRYNGPTLADKRIY